MVCVWVDADMRLGVCGIIYVFMDDDVWVDGWVPVWD